MLTVEPQVFEKYVKTGQVRLIFRNVLNHGERSQRTSEAAMCAGQQGKYWAMHGLLFEKQGEVWGTGDGGQVALMLNFGTQIEGLNQETFAQCMNQRKTQASVQAIDADQRKRGINSQPIFEIGTRRLIGLRSFEDMSRFIDASLQ